MSTRALGTRIRSEAIVLASCLAATAALAGCGGSSKAATTSTSSTSSPVNATTCGTPYTFTVGRRKVLSGSCAGLLPKHPPAVTVHRGDRFSLRIAGNANGTRTAPVPKPTGASVAITRVHGRTVYYEAKTSGQSHLTVRSAQCPTDPKVSTCSALTVSVR